MATVDTQTATSDDDSYDALVSLLALLKGAGYQFITPTPATDARMQRRRAGQIARNSADIFGRSMAFEARTMPAAILECLQSSGMLVSERQGLWKSLIRVSSLRDRLYIHSAYPTNAVDAVFFGPDSYRFADLIAAELAKAPPPPHANVVDIGTGTGVGGIVAAEFCPGARLTLTDINPKALFFARINARAAGVVAETRECRGMNGVEGQVDFALANPPYIIDLDHRAYRDGGGHYGGEVSLQIAREAVGRLRPGGCLILYTGSAIVDGFDPLQRELRAVAEGSGCALQYREIDPDVFGEELDQPGYADVDRIAVVAAIMTRAGGS